MNWKMSIIENNSNKYLPGGEGVFVVFNLFKIVLKYLCLMLQSVTSTYQTMKGVASYVLKTGKGRFEMPIVVHFVVLPLGQVCTITYLAKGARQEEKAQLAQRRCKRSPHRRQQKC